VQEGRGRREREKEGRRRGGQQSRGSTRDNLSKKHNLTMKFNLTIKFKICKCHIQRFLVKHEQAI